MELNLTKDVKNNNKKGSYSYVGQKRQAKESLTPLLNQKAELAMTDIEKAVVLHEFFALFITESPENPEPRIPEPRIPEPEPLCGDP